MKNLRHSNEMFEKEYPLACNKDLEEILRRQLDDIRCHKIVVEMTVESKDRVNTNVEKVDHLNDNQREMDEFDDINN